MHLDKDHPECIEGIQEYRFNSTSDLEILRCSVNVSRFNLDEFLSVGILLPDAMMHAVDIRKVDYLTGRYLAAVLLDGMCAESTSVPRGPNSQPVWPEGFTGSISHSAGAVICAVARAKSSESVGIDIERLLGEEELQEISDQIASISEGGLQAETSLTESEYYSLLFSAKESVFKALFPKVNRYFEFSDIELIGVDDERREFEIVIVEDLSSEFKAGYRLRGQFVFENNSVLTLVNTKYP